MIGYLFGKVFKVFPAYFILLTGGVGYKVFVTTALLEKLQEGKEFGLYITSIIKEDLFDLYGFETSKEKNLFELIISVSGIGPRTAMAVLSKFRQDDIINAVRNGDVDFFTGIKRLGRKNASKLIIELKSKIGDDGGFDFQENKEKKELVDALKSLGFQEKEIFPVLALTEKKGGTLEQKINFALKQLGGKQ